MINDRGDFAIGRDLQKGGVVLLAGADVHPMNVMVEIHFLAGDGNLSCSPTLGQLSGKFKLLGLLPVSWTAGYTRIARALNSMELR